MKKIVFILFASMYFAFTSYTAQLQGNTGINDVFIQVACSHIN